MLLDNSVTNAEPEPCSLANVLGGVERIKDSLRVFDTWSRIAELRANITIALRHTDSHRSAGTALKNGVDRVIDDVEKYLLELVRIRCDCRKAASILRSTVMLLTFRS